jgi:hypothetical protein
MVYQIEVKPDNNADFLQIIQSLKNIGLVTAFERKESLSSEGSPMSETELMSLLKERQADMAAGNSMTQDEAIKFLKLWRQINRKSTGLSKHS